MSFLKKTANKNCSRLMINVLKNGLMIVSNYAVCGKKKSSLIK